MYEQNVVYTYSGILFSLKKGRAEILTHATIEMNFEDIMLCEICQIQKDELYGSTFMEYLE